MSLICWSWYRAGYLYLLTKLPLVSIWLDLQRLHLSSKYEPHKTYRLNSRLKCPYTCIRISAHPDSVTLCCVTCINSSLLNVLSFPSLITKLPDYGLGWVALVQLCAPMPQMYKTLRWGLVVVWEDTVWRQWPDAEDILVTLITDISLSNWRLDFWSPRSCFPTWPATTEINEPRTDGHWATLFQKLVKQRN